MEITQYEITENLFQAIDTIIAERVKQLPYDTTELVTIIDATSAKGGLYKVSPDGWFEEIVYSDNPTYQVGDKVYVTKVAGNSQRFINTMYMRNDNSTRINRIFQE